LCCAFLLAVAIKTPIVPFHGWLPSLYVEAPTPVVVLLAALVGKVGLFALLQIVFPLFPDGVEVLRPYLAWLGAVAVLGGALMAWIQEDLRRILAYSSLSHLGYCVLAAAAGTEVALAGCVVQMVSHGLIIAPLFLLTGLVTDGSGVTRLTAWEGLANRVPRYSTLFLIFVLGSVGLPMTSGFIGEFLCLTGSFGKFPAATLVAALGVVFGAVYMFRLASHLLFGRLHGPRDDFAMRDLSGFELAAASGFVVLVLVIGIFPSLITEKVQIVPARIAAVTTSAGVH
jgi:NADH-quinone oxidoreductase subunit M